MENSFIISSLINIISALKEYYKHSQLKKIVNWILEGLNRSKEHSLILRILSSDSKMSARWVESSFYRIVIIPLKTLKRLLSYCLGKAEQQIRSSGILTSLDAALSNTFNYSIRSYGVFFFAVFAVEAALWIAFQANEPKYIVVRGLLLAAAFIMLLLDVPAAALFKGSLAYRFVEKGFVDSFKEYNLSKGLGARKLAGIMLLGAIVGIGAYYLPVKLVLAIAVGGFTALLILWRYEAGVFLSAGFAAILPTSALYLLMGITIFSFMLRWAVGNVPKYKATLIDAFIVMFFIVLCYGTLTSYFIRDSLSVLAIHSLMLAFYFVLARTINSRYKLYLLVVLLVISASLTSLYGVYQYYGGAASTEAWVDTTMFQDIQSRVGSTFNNPNILGEYLILMIPLGLSLLWYGKKFIYKGVFTAMLGIMGICMIYTFSRGAWLGLILALVGFFVVRDKRLFALFMIVLFILPFALPSSVMNRFTSIGNLEDTSSSYRMSILLGSLRMVQDYWISGIGLGSQAFKAIYPKYSLAAAYAHHSHNIYLQIILEMGVAGALVFMLMILVFIRASLAHQGKTKDKFLSSLMIAACMGIAGYLVQGFVENIWYNYRVLQTFWVVLAVGLCALRLAKEEVRLDA